MTIVIIAVTLVVAFVIAYNLNKKPVENVEAIQAPEKIEPPVVFEKVKVEEPKKKLVKKAVAKKEAAKKEVVKKAVKKTK